VAAEAQIREGTAGRYVNEPATARHTPKLRMSILKQALWPVPNAELPREAKTFRVGKLDRFDRWALGFIALIFLTLLVRIGDLKPAMSDTWYHLTVANRIVADGAVPGWDWWHYAPIGRPNLYPPLLHLIIAFFAKLTGSIMSGGQICAATFFPLGLLTTWYCARRLATSRVALLAVLLLMTDLFHFVIMQAYIAGCIINILMPVLMVCFLKRRAWWSILLLTAMYYAHLGFPHCVALGLVLFGLKYRGYLRLALKVVGISLVFYTPWLAHILGHLDWLAVAQQGGMPGGLIEKMLSLQSFNLVLLGLGFWGIAVAPRRLAARMLPASSVDRLPADSVLHMAGATGCTRCPCGRSSRAGVIEGLLPLEAPARGASSASCFCPCCLFPVSGVSRAQSRCHSPPAT